MHRRKLILGGAAVFGLGTLSMAANAQQAADALEIPDMVLGVADAPVEIIEYASFTCPHCATFHAEVLPQLKADYIDTGKVRLIYREVYFDRFGLWGSMIARCGGEDRYFDIANLFYEKQREWTTASGDPVIIIAELRKLAKTTGMTDEALDACMSDANMAQRLVSWYQANAERDDIRSTPSFVIDGENNANIPYARFRDIIDAKVAG
uniref:DsbA family protein n=1 Tax=Yoonia sp. TaxID=2212373 RepID=UPI0040483B52